MRTQGALAEDLIALLAGLGADPAVASSTAGDLFARHREAHRSYHTLEHVDEALQEADRLLAQEPGADPVAVRLAVWFHDAIHDPTAGPGRSEADSAALAQDRLAPLPTGDRARLADEVARLVLLTAEHRAATGDRSGAVLADADLWILSAPAYRYDRYTVAVRAEYAHVDDAAWVTGRGTLLAGFLDQIEGLYQAGDPADRVARRNRARANLGRELAALAG